jgi:hypothetical protein
MLSVSRGISSSYSCNTPCPPRFHHGFTDPDVTTVDIGDSAGQAVLEIDVDSYDNEYGPYAASVIYASTLDTDIATFDGTSVTGVSAGETGTAATVEYALYILDPGNDCYPYGTNQASVYGGVQVTPTVYISSLSFNNDPIAHHSGEAILTIQVATSTGVPANTQVVVEAFIESNPNSVSMHIFPTSGQGTVTVSGGNPGTPSFTVSSDEQNSGTGAVTYKARILSVTSGNNQVPVAIGTSVNDTKQLHVN